MSEFGVEASAGKMGLKPAKASIPAKCHLFGRHKFIL